MGSGAIARLKVIEGLEIKALDGAQVPKAAPTPEWGLHLLDGNIATGNLLADIKSQAAAFAK